MPVVTVTKYKSTETQSLEIEDGDCPACEAIRRFGCGDGVVFLVCDGKIYRCDVGGVFKFGYVLCAETTFDSADRELGS